MIAIKIVPVAAPCNDKVADAELHFTEGPLAGLRLIGFGIWARPGRPARVTYPAKTYTVNRERRTFAVLRPIEGISKQTAGAWLERQILAAWEVSRNAD